MRFKLYFSLENEIFPIQYRKSMLSFIKHSLSEYSNEYYKKLYNEKDTIIKPYTFAIFFNNPQFRGDAIVIQDKKFEFNISIQDYNIGVILYNAFNHQKNKTFSLNQNSMILKSISMTEEKEIIGDTIKIKFLSPLIVRNRNQETRKDYYHSYADEQFSQILKINIQEEIKISNMPQETIQSFSIMPIQAKKTVTRFYEKQIEGSLGIFELTGQRELLDYLYKAGIGSKRSSGFGMFTIL